MTLHIGRSSHGFTLVEALVAATLVATAAVALAQLVALGLRQTVNSRGALEALVAAQGKLEALRATTWSYTAAGSDLALSPPGSLVNDTPGYVDRVSVFVRRWAVLRRDVADADVAVIHVCVFGSTRAAEPPEACVSTIRTRRP